MKAIVNGFSTLLTLLKTLFGVIMSYFKAVGKLLTYVLQIPQIFAQIQLAFPVWLKGFVILSGSIAIIYIIIGRIGGKSD